MLFLVLCLDVVEKLGCPYDPKSCAGGSFMLLAGLAMLD